MFHRKRNTRCKKKASTPDTTLSPFESLPDEILTNITHYLDRHSIFATLSCVSHRLNDVSNWPLAEKTLENIVSAFFRTLYRECIQPTDTFIKNTLSRKKLPKRIASLKWTIEMFIENQIDLNKLFYELFFKKIADIFTKSAWKYSLNKYIPQNNGLIEDAADSIEDQMREDSYLCVKTQSKVIVKQILNESKITKNKCVYMTIGLLFFFQHELECVSHSNKYKAYKAALTIVINAILDTLDQNQLAQYHHLLTTAYHLTQTKPTENLLIRVIADGTGVSVYRDIKAQKLAMQTDVILLSIFEKLSVLTMAKMQNTDLTQTAGTRKKKY